MAMEVAHILSYWLFKNLISSIIFQYATIIEKNIDVKDFGKNPNIRLLHKNKIRTHLV